MYNCGFISPFQLSVHTSCMWKLLICTYTYLGLLFSQCSDLFITMKYPSFSSPLPLVLKSTLKYCHCDFPMIYISMVYLLSILLPFFKQACLLKYNLHTINTFQVFLSVFDTQLYNHHQNQDIEYFHHPIKFLCVPLKSTLTFSLSPWQPLIFAVPILSPFSEGPINGITQYVAVWIQLPSRSMIHLKFIHTVAYINNLFLLTAENYSTRNIFNSTLFGKCILYDFNHFKFFEICWPSIWTVRSFLQL